MAGIYFHIPFCKKRCNYCSYFVNENYRYENALVAALKKELTLRNSYFGKEQISTIYFGGGTPSSLHISQIESLLKETEKLFYIAADVEITLEGNPEDLSPSFIRALKTIGINRLSIGVQSFFNEDLQYFSRRHSAKEAIECIKNAAKNEINNVSIDLMYGYEKLTQKKWKATLQKAFSLPIRHLSTYLLSIDKGTKLYQLWMQQKVKNINEEQSWHQFKLLRDMALEHKFLQYDLSNFCKKSYQSKHNSSYLKQKNYLGVGPSAHSFNGNSRQWNLANLTEYLKKIQKGEITYHKELLTTEKKYNDYVMLSLQTTEGINPESIKSYGEKFYKHALEQANKYIKSNHLRKLSNENISLTAKGMFISNTIISNFFCEI